jgi:hypothetical protein
MDIPGHRLNHAPHIQASGFFLSLLELLPVCRRVQPHQPNSGVGERLREK